MKAFKPWLIPALALLFYWLLLPALLNWIGLHSAAHYLQWWRGLDGAT